MESPKKAEDPENTGAGTSGAGTKPTKRRNQPWRAGNGAQSLPDSRKTTPDTRRDAPLSMTRRPFNDHAGKSNLQFMVFRRGLPMRQWIVRDNRCLRFGIGQPVETDLL